MRTKKQTLRPLKYYRGLTRKKSLQRAREIEKFGSFHWRDPRAYTGFKTDTNRKTKKSSYTQKWRTLFPNHSGSLAAISKTTGVPLTYIRKSYNRGLAAWRTGHRPGATQQQWGYARVYSFLLKGNTYYTADADLVREAKKKSISARHWWSMK
jgi:hypothetical protein